MGEEEHYLYLTNIGNRDVYENNTPASFENRLNPPIQLRADREYEVGLVNCLFPKRYFGINYEEFSSRIEIWGTKYGNNQLPFLLQTFVPKINIDANDLSHLVDMLNRHMGEAFKSTLKMDFTRYFPGVTIFGLG